MIGYHLADFDTKLCGDFKLKTKSLTECRRREVRGTADEKDRAKPHRDRLMRAGQWRNSLQDVKSGCATTATPARAARRLFPFCSVVASSALRTFRPLGPPDRFQSAQADPFYRLGAIGIGDVRIRSDRIGEI